MRDGLNRYCLAYRFVCWAVMGVTACFALCLAQTAHAERIKDLTKLVGVRANPLIGYGLVVGLDGTGDKSGQVFTEQSFRSLLSNLGIQVPVGLALDAKNIAAVLVTAELPPFARKGQRIDITVSSVGSAKSLRGGTLLMTPLKGVDGQIYGLAQGNVSVGGLGVSGQDGSRVTVNIPSVGRIAGGAMVEKTIDSPFYQASSFVFQLHEADFTTAQRMVEAINQHMGPGSAEAVDAGSIRISAPVSAAKKVHYVSVIENIEVEPGESAARIVVNARTGTIVIGQHVKVTPAAVTHGSLTVSIAEDRQVSQPEMGSRGGRTVVSPVSNIDIEEKQNPAFLFSSGASLKELVHAINAVGASPSDLVAILEALKQAGAIKADIVVI